MNPTPQELATEIEFRITEIQRLRATTPWHYLWTDVGAEPLRSALARLRFESRLLLEAVKRLLNYNPRGGQ